MPTGVEHYPRKEVRCTTFALIAASMPTGVEHKARALTWVVSPTLITASMPTGVEHNSVRRLDDSVRAA